MKKTLLSFSVTLPILLIGADHGLAALTVIPQGNRPLTRPMARTSQVKLDSQQPPPYILAGRGDEKTQCSWLGICTGDEGK